MNCRIQSLECLRLVRTFAFEFEIARGFPQRVIDVKDDFKMHLKVLWIIFSGLRMTSKGRPNLHQIVRLNFNAKKSSNKLRMKAPLLLSCLNKFSNLIYFYIA